ncbi:MAG: phage major capsid protein [Sphaerochaetaceae bacterium]
MKKDKLLKAIEEAKAKSSEALEKVLAENTDENLLAYKKAMELESTLEGQLVKLEKEENPGKVDEGMEHVEMTEAKAWAKKVMEAIAVGNTYTSLVPTEVASQIQMKKEKYGKYRPFCTVHPATGSYSFAVEGDGVTVAYVAEAGSISDSTPSLTPVTLSAYKLAALVKISREAVADPAVNFIEYITGAIAKGFAKFEDDEILNGTGSANSHMTGLIPTVSAVSARVVESSAGSASFTWAELKAFLEKLADYPESKLVMNVATRTYIQGLKDDSKYIFDQSKPLDSIWGMPIIIDSANMDAPASAKKVILGGDFSFYHIADRQDLEVITLSELYAANDQVGVRAIQRIDGKCALTDAFAVLLCDTF